MSRRRSDQAGSVIWPGFVDAMTALLLVLMFVLSIFMIVQFVLREELIGKDKSLEALGTQLLALQDELSSERRRAADFRGRVATLEELLAQEEERTLALGRELAAAQEQNVTLSAELERRIAELAVTAEALSDLQGRSERLVALEQRNEELQATQLTLEERVAALELELDRKRAEAEETLTLLAAAEAKQQELSEEAIDAARQLTERERLNAFARAALAAEQEQSAESRKAIALLNAQVRDLRDQIAALEFQLRITEEREAEAQIQIEGLGEQLNRALARKVDELQRYRSEFFGRLRGSSVRPRGRADRRRPLRVPVRDPVRERLGRSGRGRAGRAGEIRRRASRRRRRHPRRGALDPTGRRAYRRGADRRQQPLRQQLGAEPGARLVRRAVLDPRPGHPAEPAGRGGLRRVSAALRRAQP